MNPLLLFRSAVAAAIFVIAIPALAMGTNLQDRVPSSVDKIQSVDADDLLWWLPVDTESVVVAQGPFRIATPSENESRDWFTRKASQEEIQLQFEQLPLELFYALGLGSPLRGSVVAYAMQGSRHFRNPLPDFEVMDYEGCSIVVFKDELGQAGDSLVRRLEKSATSKEVVSENRVLVFHNKSGPAEWDYFLAVPRPNVVLAANNREYLREVLERMAQKKTPRALPAKLPEWRFRNHAARFWGLRHYDPTQAKLDPTSPFGDDRSFGPGDPKAIGILFVLDPINERNAVITFLSGDESKFKSAAQEKTSVIEPQAGVKYEVKLLNPTPGAGQQVYTLDKSSTPDYFILTVQVALGRGMYF